MKTITYNGTIMYEKDDDGNILIDKTIIFINKMK
jgi:hypothetical protein